MKVNYSQKKKRQTSNFLRYPGPSALRREREPPTALNIASGEPVLRTQKTLVLTFTFSRFPSFLGKNVLSSRETLLQNIIGCITWLR